MKKRLLSTLLCTAMLGTMLTGCGGGNGSDDGGGADSGSGEKSGGNTYEGIEMTDEDIELTVWESTAGADEFVIQAGEKFTEMFPNIKIKYVNVELGDSPGQIALDGPAGVGPDLFATPSNAIGQLVQSGHILPTQNEEYVKGQLLASCSSAITLDGKMYGYPLSADAYALFYNRALIKDDEVPATFEELKTWCKTFNADNTGKQGFLIVPQIYYAYIFASKDGNYAFGPNGDDPESPNANTEEAIEGMKEFQGLREILDVPAADLEASQCDGAFASGSAAMYITGLWNVANFQDAGIDFGVKAIPCIEGSDTPPAAMSNARNMVVSAYSDYPNEAAAFGLFMISDEMQKLRFELTGSLPSVNVELDADYVAGFLEQLEYAAPTPSIAKMNDYWDPMDAATANIWDGADVKKELDAAQKAILAE